MPADAQPVRTLETDVIVVGGGTGGAIAPMGSRRLRHWLHHPLRSQAAAAERHAAVQGLLGLPEARRSLTDELESVPDLERIGARIALRSARPRELAALRDALPHAARAVELLTTFDVPLLAALRSEMQIDPAAHALLATALTSDPAHAVRDGDVVAAGLDAELDELRGLRDNTGQFLVELEARERARTGIVNLRVEYNRVHGFFIEVTHGQTAKVPDDYRRRQTLKNAERYITPELRARPAPAGGRAGASRRAVRRPWAGESHRSGAASQRFFVVRAPGAPSPSPSLGLRHRSRFRRPVGERKRVTNAR